MQSLRVEPHGSARRGLKRVFHRLVVPAGGPYELALNVRRPRGLYALRGDPRPLVVRLSRTLGDRSGELPRAEARLLAPVRIEVFAEPPASDEDIARAFQAGLDIGGLEDDPGDFAARLADHPVLGDLATRFRGARLTRTATVFQSFVSTVLEQLVTWAEASAAIRRVWGRYGGKIESLGLRSPPEAHLLAEAAPFALRPLGISQKKASTLLYGATRAAILERMRTLPIEEAMRQLRSMPGVGVWTTNVIARSALGHSDAILIGDAGAPFVTTLALTGTAGGDAEMVAALASFRPDRARVHQLFDLAHRIDHKIPGVPPQRLPRIDLHRREPWRR